MTMQNDQATALHADEQGARAVDTLTVDWFHNATKWGPTLEPELAARIRRFLTSPELRAQVVADRKVFPACASIALPAASLGSISLQQAITQRRSLGSDAPPRAHPLGIGDLSAVLRFSYGITGELVLPPPFPHQPLRAAPSAGALYPLEIYPVLMDVDTLPDGLYHYDVANHALTELRREDARALMPGFDLQPGLREHACAVLVVTAVVRRTVAKYLERGYRFILNDCGALIQNFYLTATARGLAGCAIGGFCDDALGRYVGIDNRAEIVALTFVLGGPAQ